MLKGFFAAKAPIDLDGARVLGLKIENISRNLMRHRDNVVQSFHEVSTKRKLFSLCGQLLGHFPVAGWLRPACSYIKRLCNKMNWDDMLDENVLNFVADLSRLKISWYVHGAFQVLNQ